MNTMQSSRILLSDRHGHALTLTQMEIGVAIHALHVLAVAFSLEPQYLKAIMDLHLRLSQTLNEQAEEIQLSESNTDTLSDIGDKAIHHSEYNPTCSLNAPGDWMEEEMEDVDCPECVAHFERLKQRRAKARG